MQGFQSVLSDDSLHRRRFGWSVLRLVVGVCVLLVVVMACAHLVEVFGREEARFASERDAGLVEWTQCEKTGLSRASDNFQAACSHARGKADINVRAAALSHTIKHMLVEDALMLTTLGCSTSPTCTWMLMKFADTLISCLHLAFWIGVPVCGYLVLKWLEGPIRHYQAMRAANSLVGAYGNLSMFSDPVHRAALDVAMASAQRKPGLLADRVKRKTCYVTMDNIRQFVPVRGRLLKHTITLRDGTQLPSWKWACRVTYEELFGQDDVDRVVILADGATSYSMNAFAMENYTESIVVEDTLVRAHEIDEVTVDDIEETQEGVGPADYPSLEARYKRSLEVARWDEGLGSGPKADLGAFQDQPRVEVIRLMNGLEMSPFNLFGDFKTIDGRFRGRIQTTRDNRGKPFRMLHWTPKQSPVNCKAGYFPLCALLHALLDEKRKLVVEAFDFSPFAPELDMMAHVIMRSRKKRSNEPDFRVYCSRRKACVPWKYKGANVGPESKGVAATQSKHMKRAMADQSNPVQLECIQFLWPRAATSASLNLVHLLVLLEASVEHRVFFTPRFYHAWKDIGSMDMRYLTLRHDPSPGWGTTHFLAAIKGCEMTLVDDTWDTYAGRLVANMFYLPQMCENLAVAVAVWEEQCSVMVVDDTIRYFEEGKKVVHDDLGDDEEPSTLVLVREPPPPPPPAVDPLATESESD